MPCLSLSSYFKPNLLRGETSDSRLVAVADRNFPNGLFAEKVAYLEEIDKFWWFFSKCHTFCNILLKIGSKP